MKENIIIFERLKTNETYDIEVPLNITANELVHALNQGLQLGINTDDPSQCYLSAENPITLLRGNTTLADYQLHDGTKVIVTK